MKLFLLLVGFVFSSPAWAQEVLLALPEVATTQTAVGKAEIEEMLREWAEQAAGDSEKFRAILQAKIHDRVSPAVAGPNLWKGTKKTIYLCDGHHRATAVHRALFESWEELPPVVQRLMSKNLQATWRSSDALKIRLDVKQTFSTRQELLKAFRAGNIGQIPNEADLASKFSQMTDEQILRLYQQMAPNLAALKNSPWRSAVGNALFRLDLKGEHFQNYLEFHLAEFLAEKYPSLEGYMSNPLGKHFQTKLERILLTDPDVFALLQNRTKPEAKGNWETDWRQKGGAIPKANGCAGLFLKM